MLIHPTPHWYTGFEKQYERRDWREKERGIGNRTVNTTRGRSEALCQEPEPQGSAGGPD